MQTWIIQIVTHRKSEQNDPNNPGQLTCDISTLICTYVASMITTSGFMCTYVINYGKTLIPMI